MEWNRGVRPSQPTNAPAGHTTGTHKKQGKFEGLLGLRFAAVLLLFSVAVLLVALSAYMVVGSPSNEGDKVNKDRMQAVFLNGGQVYFGRIGDLNDKYMTISDIYYLRVNQQVQPNQQGNQTSNDISLVKLGCELHGPEDSMVVNREMVIFWENLKNDGQVAKAVDEYKKQNPEGQKCETASSTPTTNNTQQTTPTTNTNTTTTPTTNTNTGTTRR
jgi:hypothetical protein